MKIDTLREIDTLFIFKCEKLAGKITRTKKGTIFNYDNEYLEQTSLSPYSALSFTMPASIKSLELVGDNLSPFFAGLLPEGRRLSALISQLKTSGDDIFSLLGASGKDCIGDVYASIHPYYPEFSNADELPDFDQTSFLELFEKSIIASDLNWRLMDPSIPGVQPKISASMISFPLSIKKRNKKYLIKIATAEHPYLIENEFFFTNAARMCGIKVANVQLVHDKDGKSGLLVERFDRQYNSETKDIISLHQEDACQFLDRYPQDKYRLTMREIAEGIVRFASAPTLEIGRLVELSVFSYLIGNGDLHAKNISLLVDKDTYRVSLTPAYDLVSTLPYGDQKMALKIQGRDTNFKATDFITFGTSFNVPEVAIRSILKRLIDCLERIPEDIGKIGLNDRKSDFLSRSIHSRISVLKESF